MRIDESQAGDLLVVYLIYFTKEIVEETETKEE